MSTVNIIIEYSSKMLLTFCQTTGVTFHSTVPPRTSPAPKIRILQTIKYNI